MDESEIDRRKIRLDMLRIIDNGIVCIGDIDRGFPECERRWRISWDNIVENMAAADVTVKTE